MFIDHFGYFIPNTPEWFQWIGRIAAPIFIYCVVIGFKHTSSRKKYIIRLYVSTVGMAFLNLYINHRVYYLSFINVIVDDQGYYLLNNFFAPLFMIVLIVFLIEKGK